MAEIMRASQEWASRPDDQRYATLDELAAAVGRRKAESWTNRPMAADLRIVAPGDGLGVVTYDPTAREQRMLVPSNWSFGQLCGYVGAPPSYLRKLEPQLAAINLQWGLEHQPVREDMLMLAQSNGEHRLRSMTSTSYGRIWDAQVVDAVQKANADGRWQVPAASYAKANPLRATTLYASDRDVFIFLVDPGHPIEVNGEVLFRGFYTWNSEVGSASFGLTTFLYRHVCDNRIIWGATDVKELRIRHTGGAPDRFAYEGQKYLKAYSEEGTAELVAGIKRAQGTDVPVGKDETLEQWLQARKFTKSQAAEAVKYATAEEGKARSFWDIVQGVTAYARSIPHTDERVQLERKAGDLMAMAAA